MINKNKLCAFIIMALIIFNLFLLRRIFSPPPHPEPKNYIIEKLHFDQAQIAEYEKLITNHRAAINKSDSLIMVMKNNLYNQLQNDTAHVDELMRQIAAEQYAIEQVNYHHFQDIKRLCKPEQIASFKTLSSELSRLFSRHKPPKR